MAKLIPPDLKRCQAEIHEGSFMTLGPRSWVRCTNKPKVVVAERYPGKDGKQGSMSLCESCLAVFESKYTLQSYVVTDIALAEPHERVFTRRSDGARFRVESQARSPNGPIVLIGIDEPHERVNERNDTVLNNFDSNVGRTS
jgi:hypothetical protein